MVAACVGVCAELCWTNVGCEALALSLCRKIFGLSLSATAPENGRQAAARKEAAAKVAANRSAIIGDLLKNSGIVRSKTNQYGNTLRVRPSARSFLGLQA